MDRMFCAPKNYAVFTAHTCFVSFLSERMYSLNACVYVPAAVLYVAAKVHVYDMKVGMKNAIELMDATSELYDFALNEECFEYDECGVSLLTAVKSPLILQPKLFGFICAGGVFCRMRALYVYHVRKYPPPALHPFRPLVSDFLPPLAWPLSLSALCSDR